MLHSLQERPQYLRIADVAQTHMTINLVKPTLESIGDAIKSASKNADGDYVVPLSVRLSAASALCRRFGVKVE